LTLLALQLLCYVRDGTIGTISIEVASDRLVHFLKVAIRERLQHEGIDASRLSLWKLSEPLYLGRTHAEKLAFSQKIKGMTFPDPESDDAQLELLDTGFKLSNYWPDPNVLKAGYVHVLVQVPDGIPRGLKRKRDEEEEAARAKLEVLTEPPPSSLARPTLFERKAQGLIQCNRPFAFDTIPITLLQEEFAEFKSNCKLEPSVLAYQLADDLTMAACQWYPSKDMRRDRINAVLSTGLDVSWGHIDGTSRTTDGNSKPVVIPALIRDCKNNEGCALFEAVAYYTNFLKGQLENQRYTRFPSILMTDIGKRGSLTASPSS